MISIANLFWFPHDINEMDTSDKSNPLFTQDDIPANLKCGMIAANLKNVCELYIFLTKLLYTSTAIHQALPWHNS